MRGVALPLAGMAVTLALGGAAVVSQRAYRRAAEHVLRDYAGMAGTEFVRRTAFDVGFNGYQVVAAGLRRTDAAGALALPPLLAKEARDLVRHLVVVEAGQTRLVEGKEPPPWLEPWVRAEAAALPQDRDPFLVRQRVEDGHAVTLVLVPLGDSGGRLAAFDVDPAALTPFMRHSLDRGPLLAQVVGDGLVTNAMMSVSFRDHAGGRGLSTPNGPWPEWEVEVPFGDFYRGVLAGSHVRVSLDPAAAGHLLPGGLPLQAPLAGALAAGALTLTFLGWRQQRRERRFARLREDFVVSASHELRTPLAQIRLFTETVLLGRSGSPAEAQSFLEASVREIVRLGHLVDNILDFSRTERGALDLALRPQALAPLVAQVTRAFEPLAAVRRVRVHSELDGDAWAAVDEAGFTRLLLNLLDNALKYGPESGDVTVRLRRADGDVELAVEDQGPGIPARERDAIFAPFQRLDRDRRSPVTGAGIGLALVREIAGRHGGVCTVEDREGGGGRLVVRLPRVEVPA